MTNWELRSPEQKALLNPSFCALLLWSAANGHKAQSGNLLAFETAFLILPIVLHKEARDALPKTLATSLAVWLEMNPLSRSWITERARLLVPYTKEALLFGGTHSLYSITNSGLQSNSDWEKKAGKFLNSSSEEVKLCAKRADFVGKWFAKTGHASTVMGLMGVKP